jgi:hypothetical protein
LTPTLSAIARHCAFITLLGAAEQDAADFFDTCSTTRARTRGS